MRRCLFVTLAVCCGCAEPCEELALEQPQALVVADGWEESDAGDPLAAHRPETVVCPRGGWGEEFGVFEVRTEECNYLHAEQRLMVDLAEGDGIRVRLWWQNLVSAQPAEGHVALVVGDGPHAGEVLWEVFVDIPQNSASMVYELASPFGVPKGTPVLLHLHNHGNNSWTLAEVAKVSESSCRGP